MIRVDRPDEVFGDPPVEYLGTVRTVRTVRHPATGPLGIIRNAARLAGGPDTVRTPSPDPGVPAGAALAELGHSPAQITELRTQCVT